MRSSWALRRGWKVHLFEPSYGEGENKPGILQRLWEFTLVQIHLWFFHFFCHPLDGLYIRNHIATWPSALFVRILGIPVVQEVNGHFDHWALVWPFLKGWRGLYQGAIRSQFRLAKGVIAVNESLRKWILKERGKGPVYLIPNGANISLFHPGANPSRDLPRPYVIFFGALSPWQGLDTIFAATRSSQWSPEVSLIVLGEGVEREKVERESRENPRVHYLGRQPYQQVAGFVAGSRREWTVKPTREKSL